MTTHTPTIAEQAEAISKGSADALPAEIANAFAAEQAALDAAGMPDGVAVSGTAMPDGDLLDVHGEPTSLARLRGSGSAVVVFYRGAWCPYCNVTLRTYQTELVPALAERGVALIAISPQKPDGSQSSAESNELTFAVASDPGNHVAGQLGILMEPSSEALAGQRKLGVYLTEANADGGTTLPMPTVVIVDAAGVIRWIDVHANYTTRTEVSDILSAIDAMD